MPPVVEQTDPPTSNSTFSRSRYGLALLVLLPAAAAVIHDASDPHTSNDAQLAMISHTGSSKTNLLAIDQTVENPSLLPTDTAGRNRTGANSDRSNGTPTTSGLAKLPATAAGDKLSEQEKLAVGTWRNWYCGERVLSIRGDGTATMVTKPDGVWKFAFGSRVSIEIDWQVTDGKLLCDITSGTPASKVQLIEKMWGRHWEQEILEFTAERLLVLGEDGTTEYDWVRIEPTAKTVE